MVDQDSPVEPAPLRDGDVRELLKPHLDTINPADPDGFYVADKTRAGKPELNLWVYAENKQRRGVCLGMERGEAQFWFTTGGHPDVGHVAIRYGPQRREKSYLKFERNMPWLPVHLVFEKRGFMSREEINALVEIAENLWCRRPVPSPVAPQVQCPDC